MPGCQATGTRRRRAVVDTTTSRAAFFCGFLRFCYCGYCSLSCFPRSQTKFVDDLPARQGEATAAKVLGQDVASRCDIGVRVLGMLGGDQNLGHERCRDARSKDVLGLAQDQAQLARDYELSGPSQLVSVRSTVVAGCGKRLGCTQTRLSTRRPCGNADGRNAGSES